MIKRIYIDTSVFGGYFDKEFEKDTKPFFDKLIEDEIKVLISEVLELEWQKLEHQKKFLIMKTQRSKTGIVHKMREIRDKVSFDIMEMSLDEEKNFIKKQLSELKRKRKYVV